MVVSPNNSSKWQTLFGNIKPLRFCYFVFFFFFTLLLLPSQYLYIVILVDTDNWIWDEQACLVCGSLRYPRYNNASLIPLLCYLVFQFVVFLFFFVAILLFCSPNKRSKWQTLLGNIRRLIGNKHIDNLTKGCSSEKKSATASYWTWFLHWCIGKSYWLKHVDNGTKGFR